MGIQFQHFTASDGAEIHYIDMGTGKPLLFVHGFGGASEVQVPIFERLKDKFRCLCFDQRGYGRTAGAGNMGIFQSARDAKELLEHLGIEDAIFLGYSMGAGVMFAYVEQFGCLHLDRVIIGEMSPKIINDDTWHFGLYQGWYTQEQYEKDLQTMKSNYQVFNTYFAVQTFFKHTPEEVRDFDSGNIDVEEMLNSAEAGRATLEALLMVKPEQEASNILYWKSMAENDFRETLKKINVPAAIFYAVPGSIYDARAAFYMDGVIPVSKLYRYDDCSHMAKNERMDQFIEDIGAFAALSFD